MVERLRDIRIVLVEPSHPGNIGAAARAMKTMGLSDLSLVRPKFFPHADASAMASGADDLLAAASVCESLSAALAGCSFVAATSARPRELAWPEQTPRECAEAIAGLNRVERAALVFGRENTGLTNDELALCHRHVRIGANPQYSSLNLGAAVQVLAYELRVAHVGAAAEADADPSAETPATTEELEGFYAQLQEVLQGTGFLDPQNPGHLMRRLRRLFSRARPDSREVNILRGILTSIQNRESG